MIKGYQAELMDMYEKIRTEENRKLTQRREEIKNKYPEILDLDTAIQKLCLNLSMAALKGINDPKDLEAIKDEITDLRARKYEMLVSHGYSPEYLNLHYNCPKCKDTGFIGIEKCSCFKSKLVKLYYKDSELEEAVKSNNFKNFNINLYPNHKLNDERYTPRKNIEDILDEYSNAGFNNKISIEYDIKDLNDLSNESLKIIHAIKDNGILQINEICDNTGMDIKMVNSIINELLLKDLVVEMNNKMYSIN